MTIYHSCVIMSPLIFSGFVNLFITYNSFNACCFSVRSNSLNFDETDEQKAEPEIDLGKDIKLPPDYFQFIIVDECHRSIYGKWQSVLKYFSGAKILGLTATPTPESSYVYFSMMLSLKNA